MKIKKHKLLIGITGAIAIILTVIISVWPAVQVSASSKVLSFSVQETVEAIPQFKGVEYKSPPSTSQTATNNYEINLSGETVHIGSATNAFTPSIRFNRFGTESYIELNLIGGGNTTRFTSSTFSNGIMMATNNYFTLEYKAVDLKPPYNDLGGVDFKITLKRAPSINSITFTYNHQKANAYLQPALTAQEIAEGNVRPDYVVNSIAFYGDGNQVNNGYKAGKIGHLYRMKVTDSSPTPKTTWADWGFGGGQSQITLSVDATWLASAVYPVVIAPVGDTFGYTSIGGSSAVSSVWRIYAWYNTYSAGNGTGTSMSIYGSNAAGNDTVKMALYNGTALISNSITPNITVNAAAKWWTSTYISNPVISSAINYYMAWISDKGFFTFYYDANVGRRINDQSSFTFPDPISWTTSTGTKREMSIYCTYTPSASFGISESVTSKDFGIVAASTSYYAKGSAPSNPVTDGECTFTITETGGSACDVDIKGSNATGGVGWTLTANAPGENTFRITIYKSGDNPASGIVLTTSDQEFKDNLSGSGHFHWDFKLETGTFTDGTQKTFTITLTARTHS